MARAVRGPGGKFQSQNIATYGVAFYTQGAQGFAQQVTSVNAGLQRMAQAQQRIAQSSQAMAQTTQRSMVTLGGINQSLVGAAAGADRFLGSMRRAIFTIGIFSGYITSYLVRGLTGMFDTMLKGSGYVIQMTSEFERLRISLRTVFREVGEAERAFADLKEIAKSTPFQLTDVVEGASALKAVGIDFRQTVAGGENVLTLISDMAGALGRTIPDAIFSFKEAVAEGSWISLRRRFSITMGQIESKLREVAQRSGKTMEEMFTFDTAEGRLEALGTFIKESFGGGSASLAQTLAGIKSNLIDSAQIFADMVGRSGPMQVFKQLAKEIYDLTSDMFNTGTAREWAQSIGSTLVSLSQTVMKFGKDVLFKNIRLQDSQGMAIDPKINLKQFVANVADAVEIMVDLFKKGWATGQGSIFKISSKIVEALATVWVNVFMATVRTLWEPWWGKLLITSFAMLRLYNIGETVVGLAKVFNKASTFVSQAGTRMAAASAAAMQAAAGSANVVMAGFSAAGATAAQKFGIALKAGLVGIIPVIMTVVAGAMGGQQLGKMLVEAQEKPMKEAEAFANKYRQKVHDIQNLLRESKTGGVGGGEDAGAKALVDKLGGYDKVKDTMLTLNKALNELQSINTLDDDTRGMKVIEIMQRMASITAMMREQEDLARTAAEFTKDRAKYAEMVRSAHAQISGGGMKEVEYFDKYGAMTTEGADQIEEDAQKRFREKNAAIREATESQVETIRRLRVEYEELVETLGAQDEQTKGAARNLAIQEAALKIEDRKTEMRNYNYSLFMEEERITETILRHSRAEEALMVRIGVLQKIGTEESKEQAAELLKIANYHAEQQVGLNRQLKTRKEQTNELKQQYGVMDSTRPLLKDFTKEIAAAHKKVEDLRDTWAQLAEKIVKSKLSVLDMLAPLREFEIGIQKKLGLITDDEAFKKTEKGRMEDLSRYDAALAANTEALIKLGKEERTPDTERRRKALEIERQGIQERRENTLKEVATARTDREAELRDELKNLKGTLESQEQAIADEMTAREREAADRRADKIYGRESFEPRTREQQRLDAEDQQKRDKALKEQVDAMTETQRKIEEVSRALGEMTSGRGIVDKSMEELKKIQAEKAAMEIKFYTEGLSALQSIDQNIRDAITLWVTQKSREAQNQLEFQTGVSFKEAEGYLGTNTDVFMKQMQQMMDSLRAGGTSEDLWNNSQFLRAFVLNEVARLQKGANLPDAFVAIIREILNQKGVPQNIKDELSKALKVVIEVRTEKSVTTVVTDGVGETTIPVDAGGA